MSLLGSEWDIEQENEIIRLLITIKYLNKIKLKTTVWQDVYIEFNIKFNTSTKPVSDLRDRWLWLENNKDRVLYAIKDEPNLINAYLTGTHRDRQIKVENVVNVDSVLNIDSSPLSTEKESSESTYMSTSETEIVPKTEIAGHNINAANDEAGTTVIVNDKEAPNFIAPSPDLRPSSASFRTPAFAPLRSTNNFIPRVNRRTSEHNIAKPAQNMEIEEVPSPPKNYKIPGPRQVMTLEIFNKIEPDILTVTQNIIKTGDMNTMTVGQALKEIADEFNGDFDETMKIQVRAVVKKVVSELLAKNAAQSKKNVATVEPASKKRKLPEREVPKRHIPERVPDRPAHERVVPPRVKKTHREDSGPSHSELPDSRKNMRDPEAKNDVNNIMNDARKTYVKNGSYHDTRRHHKESNNLLEMLSNVATNDNEYSINLSDYSDDEDSKNSKGSSSLFFIGILQGLFAVHKSVIVTAEELQLFCEQYYNLFEVVSTMNAMKERLLKYKKQFFEHCSLSFNTELYYHPNEVVIKTRGFEVTSEMQRWLLINAKSRIKLLKEDHKARNIEFRKILIEFNTRFNCKCTLSKLVSIYQSLPNDFLSVLPTPKRVFESDTKVNDMQYSFSYVRSDTASKDEFAFSSFESNHALLVNKYCPNCNCLACQNTPEKFSVFNKLPSSLINEK